MVSLMHYRATVGLHNIYMKAKEYSCRKREVLVYAVIYVLPGGDTMYLSTLKKSNSLKN